jgi:hypothetical protein
MPGVVLGHSRDLAMPKEGAGGTSGRTLLVASVLIQSDEAAVYADKA